MGKIAGESWTVRSIHQQGFDSFATAEQAERVKWLRAALEGRAVTITSPLWTGIANRAAGA